jgi:hypothetical protein
MFAIGSETSTALEPALTGDVASRHRGRIERSKNRAAPFSRWRNQIGCQQAYYLLVLMAGFSARDRAEFEMEAAKRATWSGATPWTISVLLLSLPSMAFVVLHALFAPGRLP